MVGRCRKGGWLAKDLHAGVVLDADRGTLRRREAGCGCRPGEPQRSCCAADEALPSALRSLAAAFRRCAVPAAGRNILAAEPRCSREAQPDAASGCHAALNPVWIAPGRSSPAAANRRFFGRDANASGRSVRDLPAACGDSQRRCVREGATARGSRTSLKSNCRKIPANYGCSKV